MSDYSKVLLYITLGVVIAVYFHLFKTISKAEPQEPQSVSPSIPIPFIGHLIGLLWQRNEYYTNLSSKHNLPIVSISILGGKIYIISSPELMQSLQRFPQTVSFWYLEAQFTVQLGAMSKETAKLMTTNLEPGAQQPNTLMMGGLKATHQAMTPLGGIDEMNRVAAMITKMRLDDLASQGSQQSGMHAIDLWEWVKHEITVATTECVYGAKNPYRDPKVESGFWDFADGTINILMANFLPKAFASKGIAGREAVTRAMMKYFAENSYLEASALVQARYTTMKNNIADTDIARFETVNGIAILANTVPTAFWAIFHTFADAVLLEKVRSQVEAITSISEDGSIRTINLRRLKEAPIISSTIQESLRHRSTGTGPRMIMEDIRIGGSLLKKGSVAIIANKILHFNQNAWGPDFEKFNVDRFINKFPAHAFRGFGGGANTCPGKAFAMVEVGALIAMLVMRFDLKPISTEQWEEPGQDLTNMSLQIAPPERRPIVSFVARPGTKDITWEFSQ